MLGMSKIYSIVTNTGNYPISFEMNTPDNSEIPNVPDGYKRRYYILNLHMDIRTGEYSLTKIPVILSEDEKTFTWSSNKFSTFIFAYEDIKEEEEEGEEKEPLNPEPPDIPETDIEENEEPTQDSEVPTVPNTGFINKSSMSGSIFGIIFVPIIILSVVIKKSITHKLHF